MIPFLPTSVASAEVSEAALARATEAGSSASLQPEEGYSEVLPPGFGGGRSPEAVGFPAVLLALASLGTPLHAMPVADTPKGDSPAAGVEGAGPPASSLVEVEAAPETDVTRAIELALPWVVAFPTGGAAVELDGDMLEQVAPPADTVTLDGRMLANLSGDFTSRLERVADRMWSEFGVRLEIVEGYRTQARQDSLFQQGRTEPGQVVTWTRNSLHSLGAAADVYVDGAPIQPAQAATLFRIAGEEGLKTLYPYDAGHVQIQGLDDFAGPEGPLLREGRPTPGDASTARLGVARVAPVAPVARPARPGGVVLGPEFDAGVTPLDQGVGATGTDQRIGRGTSESPSSPLNAALRRSGSSDQLGAAPTSKGAASPTTVDANLPQSERSSRAAGTSDRAAGTADVSAARITPPVDPDGATGADTSARERAKTATQETASAGRQSGDASSAGLATQAASLVAADRTSISRVAVQQSVPDPGPIHDAVLVRTTEGLAYRRIHVPIEVGAASLDLGIRPGGVDALLNISDPQLASDLQKNLHQLRQVLADRGVEARGLAVRLVADQTPDVTVRGVEAVSARSSDDGLVSSSHSDRHRGRQEALRDRAEERNQQSRSQRERQEDERS